MRSFAPSLYLCLDSPHDAYFCVFMIRFHSHQTFSLLAMYKYWRVLD